MLHTHTHTHTHIHFILNSTKAKTSPPCYQAPRRKVMLLLITQIKSINLETESNFINIINYIIYIYINYNIIYNVDKSVVYMLTKLIV